jgi:CTP:molybdopterin cytidylyltransferase MocA
MTVAATILAATAESALADTLGQPRVRRLVDIAWAGGALPVVVLSPDPDGTVARALVGSEATHGSHAPGSSGAAGQMARGIELARAEVRDTTAVLVWPIQMTWVGPETVTSLIEAHGVEPETILRPAWEGKAGWPVLLPVSRLDALRAVEPDRRAPDVIASLAAAFPSRLVDLGDPGATYDADTPHAALPPYEGPPEPPAGHTHEWGADVEAEAGLAGPSGGA